MSDAIARASWAGTLVFAVVAVAAVLRESAELVAAIVSLALFAAGIGVFAWAYAIAVGRSRTHEIGIGGLFFLAGAVAPASARWRLLTPLAVQVVVALGTAAARPFTSLAFGVLVPLYGLALCGLWGARHGTFAVRAPGGTGPRRRTL